MTVLSLLVLLFYAPIKSIARRGEGRRGAEEERRRRGEAGGGGGRRREAEGEEAGQRICLQTHNLIN